MNRVCNVNLSARPDYVIWFSARPTSLHAFVSFVALDISCLYLLRNIVGHPQYSDADACFVPRFADAGPPCQLTGTPIWELRRQAATCPTQPRVCFTAGRAQNARETWALASYISLAFHPSKGNMSTQPRVCFTSISPQSYFTSISLAFWHYIYSCWNSWWLCEDATPTQDNSPSGWHLTSPPGSEHADNQCSTCVLKWSCICYIFRNKDVFAKML